jgi:hypothetical protein
MRYEYEIIAWGIIFETKNKEQVLHAFIGLALVCCGLAAQSIRK